MPSLSKVSQRGASSLVSTTDSVTHALHYLPNKVADTALTLNKSILPKAINLRESITEHQDACGRRKMKKFDIEKLKPKPIARERVFAATIVV
jgi:hypothetical protein